MHSTSRNLHSLLGFIRLSLHRHRPVFVRECPRTSPQPAPSRDLWPHGRHHSPGTISMNVGERPHSSPSSGFIAKGSVFPIIRAALEHVGHPGGRLFGWSPALIASNHRIHISSKHWGSSPGVASQSGKQSIRWCPFATRRAGLAGLLGMVHRSWRHRLSHWVLHSWRSRSWPLVRMSLIYWRSFPDSSGANICVLPLPPDSVAATTSGSARGLMTATGRASHCLSPFHWFPLLRVPLFYPPQVPLAVTSSLSKLDPIRSR